MNELLETEQEEIQQILTKHFGGDSNLKTPIKNNQQFTYTKCDFQSQICNNKISSQAFNQLLDLKLLCQQSLEIHTVREASRFAVYKNLVIPTLKIQIEGDLPENIEITLELKCYGERKSRQSSYFQNDCIQSGNRCNYQEVQFENKTQAFKRLNSLNDIIEFKSIRFSQESHVLFFFQVIFIMYTRSFFFVIKNKIDRQINTSQLKFLIFQNQSQQSNKLLIKDHYKLNVFQRVKFIQQHILQNIKETTSVNNQYRFFILMRCHNKNENDSKSFSISIYKSDLITIISRKKSLQRRNAAINLIQPFVPFEFQKRLEYKKNNEYIQKEITNKGIDGFMEFISNSNIRHKSSQVLYKIQKELSEKFINLVQGKSTKSMINKLRSPIIIIINIKSPHCFKSIQRVNTKNVINYSFYHSFFVKIQIRKLMEPITSGQIDIVFQDENSNSIPENYLLFNNDDIIDAYKSIYPQLLEIIFEIKKQEFPPLNLTCLEDINIEAPSDINNKNIKVQYLIQQGGYQKHLEKNKKKTFVNVAFPKKNSSSSLSNLYLKKRKLEGEDSSDFILRTKSGKPQNSHNYDLNEQQQQISSLMDEQNDVTAQFNKNFIVENQYSQILSEGMDCQSSHISLNELLNQSQSDSVFANNQHNNIFDNASKQQNILEKQIYDTQNNKNQKMNKLSNLSNQLKQLKNKCGDLLSILKCAKQKFNQTSTPKKFQLSMQDNTLNDFISQFKYKKQIESVNEDF